LKPVNARRPVTQIAIEIGIEIELSSLFTNDWPSLNSRAITDVAA